MDGNECWWTWERAELKRRRRKVCCDQQRNLHAGADMAVFIAEGWESTVGGIFNVRTMCLSSFLNIFFRRQNLHNRELRPKK